ncbi:hypothetical protein P280DRAFT_511309 [Massarina eburnea CBS 473.64]|uniref:Zn(2)-C6 fungal-type domain-containing protein n=1 Tax=Massarina eburnea CBS 473.64 TaxID=1395130 RepID=A0A6A6RL60_9PLEO|nr:hypothetical protein P280DRAFT_511309 [Massarina eburnea CBS 473.64]
MPRLGSKKSRGGCQQCKIRRVKCDESRPCANCTRYNADCSLLAGPPSVGSVNRSSSYSRGRSSHEASVSPAPSSNTGVTYGAGRSVNLPLAEEASGGWMEDLELMHHFTAHAHTTIPGPATAQQIWGFSVPQEAFKYRFLMHAILAFAAEHLAHINPTRAQHYRILGSTHQAAAITGLNNEISTVDLTSENCHALFTGASLIIMNAFAEPEAYNLKALVSIFTLCRGMNTILMSSESTISKGPFAGLLRPLPNPPQPSPLLSSFLVDINALAEGSHPSYSVSRNNGHDTSMMARNDAAELLRESLQLGIETSQHPALRAAMLWPIRLDPEYLECLKARSDPAVASVFRQYCRILEYAGAEWWFLSGWRNISQQFLLHA